MNGDVEIVTVDAANVDEHGFFCYKSKPKSEGYRRKLGWLRERFAEGMKIKIVYENGRSKGFIEYAPAEGAWRAVNAEGYSVMHCLWVVGKAKGKGYASRLLDEWVEDARKMQMRGVAAVTSRRSWLVGPKVFLKHGFEVVDKAPPTFELLTKKFGDVPSPTFPQDWDERLSGYGSGLTVVRCDQCPYIDDAVMRNLEVAAEMGIPGRVVELKSPQQVQDSAPSAYGVFSVVHNGKLVTYELYLPKEKLLRRLSETPA